MPRVLASAHTSALSAVPGPRGKSLWYVGRARPGGGNLFHLTGGSAKRVARVGLAPSALAVTSAAVWVANGSGKAAVYNFHDKGPGFPLEQSIQRVDPDTHDTVATIPVREPCCLVVHHGSVWAATAATPSTLTEIDATTNRVRDTFRVNGTITSMAANSDGIWAVVDRTPRQNAVVRVDASNHRTMDVHELNARSGGAEVAAHGHRVWVLLKGAGELISIDSSQHTPSSAAMVQVKNAESLACDQRCWVSSDDATGFHLYRIGPSGEKDEADLKLSGYLTVLAAQGQGVWVQSGPEIVHLRIPG